MKTRFFCFIFVLTALSFFSCSTKTDNFIGPDGNVDKKVKCKNDVNICYSRAKDVCNGPYTVASTTPYVVQKDTYYVVLVNCVP